MTSGKEKRGYNAAQASPDMENKQENDFSSFVTVTITDTGAGIDQAIIPNLFSKFVTKSASGTGIGLYISKAIIEAHGGTIWGRNNNNGRGAEFGFRLPITK